MAGLLEAMEADAVAFIRLVPKVPRGSAGRKGAGPPRAPSPASAAVAHDGDSCEHGPLSVACTNERPAKRARLSGLSSRRPTRLAINAHSSYRPPRRDGAGSGSTSTTGTVPASPASLPPSVAPSPCASSGDQASDAVTQKLMKLVLQSHRVSVPLKLSATAQRCLSLNGSILPHLAEAADAAAAAAAAASSAAAAAASGLCSAPSGAVDTAGHSSCAGASCTSSGGCCHGAGSSGGTACSQEDPCPAWPSSQPQSQQLSLSQSQSQPSCSQHHQHGSSTSLGSTRHCTLAARRSLSRRLSVSVCYAPPPGPLLCSEANTNPLFACPKRQAEDLGTGDLSISKAEGWFHKCRGCAQLTACEYAVAVAADATAAATAGGATARASRGPSCGGSTGAGDDATAAAAEATEVPFCRQCCKQLGSMQPEDRAASEAQLLVIHRCWCKSGL